MPIAVATKGSITVVGTGERVPFMFNPNAIGDSKATNYVEQGVPGISHPVLQYAGGGRRAVSFELYLDGDRGRGRPRLTNANRSDKGDSIDIADEIAFYQSLLYPANGTSSLFADILPYMLLFSFGVMYQAMPCVLTKGDPNMTSFQPNLSPMRATISIELVEKIDRGRVRSDIYTRG